MTYVAVEHFGNKRDLGRAKGVCRGEAYIQFESTVCVRRVVRKTPDKCFPVQHIVFNRARRRTTRRFPSDVRKFLTNACDCRCAGSCARSHYSSPCFFFVCECVCVCVFPSLFFIKPKFFSFFFFVNATHFFVGFTVYTISQISELLLSLLVSASVSS